MSRRRNGIGRSGYLMGVATHHDQGGTADPVVLDAERPEAGSVATVRMPVPVVGQVHGGWVPEWQMPRA
jgi:carotenoid cleavage dioxygenase-like enzyme